MLSPVLTCRLVAPSTDLIVSRSLTGGYFPGGDIYEAEGPMRELCRLSHRVSEKSGEQHYVRIPASYPFLDYSRIAFPPISII